ncbi:hypothetical protein JTE90_021144 [Oedothorax gibbosus]|uniref:Uncharacterized protein n=1 Tax=Oedothorax gibbosus TaxID=931172 RepID=A0AAV6U264_9ARAC|nr:hypothetical protein JTE90_021144 [Oedothorax gibbosus]
MCSALAYIPLEFIDDAWLIIWEIAYNIRKLSPFIDYFVDEWMDNPNKPIKLCNVHSQRHRTNKPVES